MNTNPKPLWSAVDVCEYLGIGDSTFYRLTKDPSFPPPIRLSARAVRWRPEQVFEWTRSRQSANTVTPRKPGRPARRLTV